MSKKCSNFVANFECTMENILIANALEADRHHALKGYLIHGLCTAGSAVVRFNEQEFTLRPNDSFIFVQSERTELISQTDDFQAVVVYVVAEFCELATPLSNYGMRGGLMLFQNPIMSLNKVQSERCRKNLEYIGVRMQEKQHHFYRDLLLNAVQCMIIDFFDFHTELYGETRMSEKVASLVQGFMTMLNDGHYRQHREVSFYSDGLGVTAKHLSETVKEHSGYPAIYWINRYTALEVARLLRNPSLTLQDIADILSFSSVSYLSRFVAKHLGFNPSEMRK